MSLMTICEQGLGSNQVDLGGVVIPSSAIEKIVSMAGSLTKKMVWCFRSSS